MRRFSKWLLGLIGLVFAGFLHYFFEEETYGTVLKLLEDRLNLKATEVVALVATYAVPLAVSCVVMLLAYFYGRSHREKEDKPALEIIFDPSNPAKRFWSIESLRDGTGQPKPGTFWEYRLEIKNNSSRTLRNVSVTTEHIGQLPVRPVDQVFDKIKRASCNLKSGCSELVPIFRWPNPKIQGGMLAGPSALEYGPIKVVASADDVTPTVALFKFNYQAEPMLLMS